MEIEGPELSRYGDTVDALLAAVVELSKAEDRREQSFNTRAGGLAGFAGIIVSIATTGGKLALDQDPSRFAAVLAATTFAIALIALLLALGVAVVEVLIPQESAAIGMATIERYPTHAYVTRQKVDVQGELLRGTIDALAKDRQRNDAKATALRCAYVSLLVGVVAMVVFGGILAVEAL